MSATESKASIDTQSAREYLDKEWEATILSSVTEYITVPNQSPQFDSEYLTNGHVQKAMSILTKWVEAQNVPGLKMEVLEPANRTPLIFITVDATDDKVSETVLMYGHMDKQPPLDGTWAPGLGPYKPVLKDGKLYGRGGADDGYSIYAAVSAVQILKKQNLSHAKIVIMVESCEESGSRDLMYYVEEKKEEIGNPTLVVCLDSGCGNYEQMWLTTSLRGMLLVDLRVKILKEGVHSGSASGIVPSSFRIAREVLDKIEDSKTGKLLVKEAYTEIPPKFRAYAEQTAKTLGEQSVTAFPFLDGVKPMSDDLTELILNQTWRPTVSYTGVEGIPPFNIAGNVLRPETGLKLSVRLPPTVEVEPVDKAMREIVEANTPYGSQVTLSLEKGGRGWSMPELSGWLEDSLNKGSNAFFGKSIRLWGEGGSIPFMGMLGRRYPGTQFVITGVLGPGSNAHGPNEFLHIQMAKNVTGCVANVLADHYKALAGGKAAPASASA